MADPYLITYADLVDHLVAHSRGGGQDAEQRDIRMSVLQAYQNLVQDADYPYCLKHHRLQFVASTTLSDSLDYDHEADGNVEDATNATPIVITSRGHGLQTGNVVTVRDVGGNTAANGEWTIRRVSATTFSLIGSAGNGAWTSGGTWKANRRAVINTSGNAVAIDSWTTGTPLTVTAPAHGLATGDYVLIYNATTRLDVNATWKVTVTDSSNFTLDGSEHASTTPAGGFLQEFAAGFPSWIEYGRISISDTVAGVRRKLNDVCVEVDESINWGSDLSDQDATIYRSEYPLPADFRGAYTQWEEDRLWSSTYIHPDEWLRLERVWQQAGGPFYWTVLPDRRKPGGFVAAFHGYPDEAQTMDFMYYGRGRDIKYSGYESRAYSGTATVTAGSRIVTGTSTSWTKDMAGSVMRFSTDTTDYPTGIGDLNPYGDQEIIREVVSSTKLILEEAPDSSYSATLFRISDPIDLDSSLVEAIKRGSELQLAHMRGGDVRLKKEVYNDAVLRSMERQARSKEPYCKGEPTPSPWVGWWTRGTITNP